MTLSPEYLRDRARLDRRWARAKRRARWRRLLAQTALVTAGGAAGGLLGVMLVDACALGRMEAVAVALLLLAAALVLLGDQ